MLPPCIYAYNEGRQQLNEPATIGAPAGNCSILHQVSLHATQQSCCFWLSAHFHLLHLKLQIKALVDYAIQQVNVGEVTR